MPAENRVVGRATAAAGVAVVLKGLNPESIAAALERGGVQKLSDRDLAIVGWTGLPRVASLEVATTALGPCRLTILQALQSLPDPLPALSSRLFQDRQQLQLLRGVRHVPSVPQVFRNQR